MTLIVLPDPPADGETADASDVNDQDNAIVAVVNGNLDDSNIASLSGTKLTAGTIPETAYSAAAKQGWYNISTLPSTVTYNGNRSYDVTYGADLTTVVSTGTKMRFQRSVAAPTQCANFNGTNQYFSKTSPAGMTFTNNFVAGAWVKLTSYSAAGIITRFNGTSGWVMQTTASGQVQLWGFNGSAANYSNVQSYQSIPLNKWVHVAAQLDMTSTTNSPTVNYITIDGVDVPCTVTRGGTNPTALVQAGNLEIGSWNGGTNLLTGKIAQAFVTSAKLTQTQVRAIYSQGLTASSTTTYSMASAYTLSGASGLTDLNTTSANNLTANNSVTTTTTDAPWTQDDTATPGGSLDFGIVTKRGAYSGGNTIVTVQVPEGCALPTSGGVAASSYATVDSPFGVPKQKERWRIKYLCLVNTSGGVPTANTWYNSGVLGSPQLLVPVGDFELMYSAIPNFYKAGTLGVSASITLSTSSSTQSDVEYTTFIGIEGANATLATRAPLSMNKGVSNAAATSYYLNVSTTLSSGGDIGLLGAFSPTMITAIPACL